MAWTLRAEEIFSPVLCGFLPVARKTAIRTASDYGVRHLRAMCNPGNLEPVRQRVSHACRQHGH